MANIKYDFNITMSGELKLDKQFFLMIFWTISIAGEQLIELLKNILKLL